MYRRAIAKDTIATSRIGAIDGAITCYSGWDGRPAAMLMRTAPECVGTLDSRHFAPLVKLARTFVTEPTQATTGIGIVSYSSPILSCFRLWIATIMRSPRFVTGQSHFVTLGG